MFLSIIKDTEIDWSIELDIDRRIAKMFEQCGQDAVYILALSK